MRRREFITLLGGAAAAWALAARAQQGVRRLGMLMLGAGGSAYEIVQTTLPNELAKPGWVEGRNLRVDRRDSVDPKSLLSLADELVSLRPDVIFTFTGLATRTVNERTQTIPIIFVGGGDPAENGLVGQVARPAGNATGFANNFNSLGAKQLELLKRAVPSLTSVAHVFDPDAGVGGARPMCWWAPAELRSPPSSPLRAASRSCLRM